MSIYIYSGTSLIRTSEMRTPRFNGRSAQERISLPTTATLFNPRNADTPLFRKADEFLCTEAHYVNGLLGRLMRTWSRQSSGAPSGLGLYLTSKHSPGSLRSWCRRVSRVPWSIEREALNVVQELYKLSAHNLSKVFGVLLEFCDSRTPNTPRARALLVFPRFFAISGSWWFHGIFVRVLCSLNAQ